MDGMAQLSLDIDENLETAKIVKEDFKIGAFDFDAVVQKDCKIERVCNQNSLVILSDCLAALKYIKRKSIHLIFADAPYNIGKDFGNNKDQWESEDEYIDWCKC